MSQPRKIRVLIVDDSSMVRKMIADSLAHDPQIEVVGAAPDPYVARDMIVSLKPDVLTLDIEMPRMDGITFLKILQEKRPMPVIVISSLAQAGSQAALDAHEAGAVDVLAKPDNAFSIGDLGKQLAMRVKVAAIARMRPAGTPTAAPPPSTLAPHTGTGDPRQIILIGSSTGGIEALNIVLPQLPANSPGICIVQHIPPHFSKMVADRLNTRCAIEVREARDGDEVRPGLALIAPGDFHMTLNRPAGAYKVALNQKPAMHFCRPAVDILFASAAACVGTHAVAAILTGMGSDGALGMQKLKAAGARTIAQDEATSVVYGMPRAAAALGVVDRVVPLPQIARTILSAFQAPALAHTA